MEKVICHFCLEPAHGPCSWPVERFYVGMACQIIVGDTIRRWKESVRDHTSTATVEHVQYFLAKVRIGIMIRRKKQAPKPKAFDVTNETLLRVKRVVPCGQLACQNHLAARGPGIYNCSDHWNSWQAVA